MYELSLHKRQHQVISQGKPKITTILTEIN